MSAHIDFVGRRFGRLVVVSESKELRCGRRPKYLVNCVCDCGKKVTLDKYHVSAGHTRSCGCLLVENGKDRALPPGAAAFNELYGVYRNGARVRGYSFELTKEEFKNIATQPCLYCGEQFTNSWTHGKNGTFDFTGIDRYDNTKGYTVENSVPCCAMCNRIKMAWDVQTLRNHLQKMTARCDEWAKRGESL